MKRLLRLGIAAAFLGCFGCKFFFGPGGRYSARDKNCVVKKLPRAPTEAFDDLGIVSIDCWAGNNDGCEQEFLDEVCRRGGDVVWGLGDPAPSTGKMAAHVGRTRPTTKDVGDGGTEPAN
jgi:hypothetical protein